MSHTRVARSRACAAVSQVPPVPPDWEHYLHLQAMADPQRITDKAWAVDEALEEHLNAKREGSVHRDPETRLRMADNRITNRRKVHARRRKILLQRYAAGTSPVAPTESPEMRAARREVISTLRAHASRFEWIVLRRLARGNTYYGLAAWSGTKRGTLKSIVSRCRRRLFKAQTFG